jgi:toxin HigB-1
MIRSFRHKGLAALYHAGQSKGVNQEHVKRLRQILAILDSAIVLDDINAPGLRLHPLKGRKADFYAVSVSGNWRVTFRFETGDVVDVDYVDYH